MNARFLNEEEKYYATSRLAANRTGIATQDSVWKWDQFREALLDIRVWLVFLYNISINIPNGGLVTFGSIIIKNLGFTSLEASLLTMPFGLFCTFGAWCFSFWAGKWKNRRTIVAGIACLCPLLGTAMVYGIPRSIVSAQMVGLYLMYLYWRKSEGTPCHKGIKMLTTQSTICRLHLPASGEHRRPNQEGRRLCDRQYWLLCRQPDWPTNLPREPSP